MDYTSASGIHTLSFSKTLTAGEYYQILHSAQKQGMHIRSDDDFFAVTSSHTLLGYQKRGVVIYLSHPRSTVYKLKLRIEPERVLGNTDPQALWRCEKGDWKRLAKAVDGLLGALDIPSLKEMKLSILELTVNLTFPQQEYVDLYIQILKKGYLNKHYRRIQFDKHASKTKNVQEANRHSYKAACKQKSFFAYDKTAQLLMTERIVRLPDHRTLRMEVSLWREAIKKELGTENGTKYYLEQGSKHAERIVHHFLKKLLLSNGVHLPYDTAMAQVQQFKSAKMRQRAECLLQLCSRKKSLDKAIEAMQEELEIKRSAVDRVIKRLKGLGLSPITIPIRRHAEPLPSLLTLIG